MRNLPAGQATIVPAEPFSEIMQDLAAWGDILFQALRARCAPN